MGKLTEAARQKILVLAVRANSDDEAAAIIKREVLELVGDGQIHHPISQAVYDALEKHKNLRGKYQLRDPRFEALAKDAASHRGYEGWHRELDKEVAAWIHEHKNADAAEFEAFLRERYDEKELKKRFPGGF